MVILAGNQTKVMRCTVKDCLNPAYIRTYCRRHYSLWYRHGSTDDRPRWRDPDTLFWSKVNFEGPNGCWLWTAYLDRDGYGLFSTNFLKGRACRLSYLLLVGDVDPTLVMDHVKCRNRACVNPYHLEPVTQKINAKRTEKAERTHCARGGHPLSGGNLYIYRGLRNCKRCRADTQLARYHRSSSGSSGQGWAV